jgi:hypothetical protein
MGSWMWCDLCWLLVQTLAPLITDGHTALDAALHFKHPAIAALLKAKIAELSGST